MANYAEKADIEALLGYTISDDPATRPTAIQLTILLNMADKIINNEIGTPTNVTDTYGILKPIAANLVQKMIHNLYHFTRPEDFDMFEIALTEEQKREIHKEHWTMKSWEIGN